MPPTAESWSGSLAAAAVVSMALLPKRCGSRNPTLLPHAAGGVGAPPLPTAGHCAPLASVAEPHDAHPPLGATSPRRRRRGDPSSSHRGTLRPPRIGGRATRCSPPARRDLPTPQAARGPLLFPQGDIAPPSHRWQSHTMLTPRSARPPHAAGGAGPPPLPAGGHCAPLASVAEPHDAHPPLGATPRRRAPRGRQAVAPENLIKIPGVMVTSTVRGEAR